MKKKKPYKKKNTKSVEAREPETNYGDSPKLGDIFKTITVASLEEMEDERRAYSAGLSPLQRIAYLQELNQFAFGIQLIQPLEKLWDKTIHIEKPA